MKNTLLYPPIFLLLLLVISNSIIAQKVAGGRFHSLVICEDSTIWSFGRNQLNNGQLGLGHYNEMTVPAQIPSLKGMISVTADNWSIALKSDGTVWRWGPYSGANPTHTPSMISGLTNIIKVKSKLIHLVAIKNDNTVWTWGYNDKGQLGHNGLGDVPMQVPGITGVIDIAGGYFHTMALKNDGTVWAWGENLDGQLGDGTDSNNRHTPMQVSNLTNVIAIAAGGYHSLALKSDGTVWAWGRNSNGQLGDGSTSKRLTPVQVAGGLNNVKSISAGDAYSIALRNDGTAMSWGSNGYGQLGIGNDITRTTPALVSGFSNCMEIDAGDEHTLAIKNDGSLWAWGNNLYRRLGDGTTTNRNEPVKVQNVCINPGINVNSLQYENAFEIYPIPATDRFHILNRSVNHHSETVFVLYDLHGRQTGSVKLNASQHVFERENLDSGIYFYRIHNENQVVKSGKVVFE